MTPAALFACVLSLTDPSLEPLPNCWEDPHVQRLTNAAGRAAQETGVPARIILAVAYHESMLDPNAVGARGEIGYMQLLRRGALRGTKWRHASVWLLRDPIINLTLGARYLARIAKSCKAPPVYYLSRYNGRPCRPSRYSRGVMEDLRTATAEVRASLERRTAVKYIVDVRP